MTAPKSPREKKPKPPRSVWVTFSQYGPEQVYRHKLNQLRVALTQIRYDLATPSVTPSERERLERAVVQTTMTWMFSSHNTTARAADRMANACIALRDHLRASRQSRRMKGGG